MDCLLGTWSNFLVTHGNMDTRLVFFGFISCRDCVGDRARENIIVVAEVFVLDEVGMGGGGKWGKWGLGWAHLELLL